jgi:hypothetical protein
MHALLKTTSMAMKKILEELYSIVKNWENDGCHKNCAWWLCWTGNIKQT